MWHPEIHESRNVPDGVTASKMPQRGNGKNGAELNLT